MREHPITQAEQDAIDEYNFWQMDPPSIYPMTPDEYAEFDRNMERELQRIKDERGAAVKGFALAFLALGLLACFGLWFRL